MNKKILLINPNTYRSPSAKPLGLEYIGAALDSEGWEVEICDLCFSDNPIKDAARAVQETEPLFTGVTIRNIDTALYQNNVFFIPGIKEIVDAIKTAGGTVVLGGAGFSGAPELILNEVGVDYGVEGPGECAIIQIAEKIAAGENPERVTDGWRTGFDTDFVPQRPFLVDYRKYIDNRGIPGFATHYGCNRACEYCIEAGTPLIFRNPPAVVEELRILASAGYKNFHLCDSEFNTDLSYAETFALELAAAGLGINWSLYMLPAPWSRGLFKSLENSGADIITLSVDSSIINGTGGFYNYEDVISCIELAAEHKIRLAVDLSTGLPGEPEESTAKTIELFRKHTPDTVGVNSFFRVYPGTLLERNINRNPDLSEYIITPHGETGIAPHFYNHLSVERLAEIIGEHHAFRIEGFDAASNYERLD